MKTLIQRAREGARRAAAKAAQTAKRALPRAKALWDRFGYALSMLALLALIGGAASLYRSRAQQSAQSAPTPTPEPALVSSVALNAQMEAQEEPSFLMPVQGEIVGAFAPDELTWSDTLKLWQTHDGIDIAAPLGSAVTASEDGVVLEAYDDPLLGNVVRIAHEGGYETLYASLQSLELAQAGQQVKAGDVIGAVGNSAEAETELGAHVHFALYQDGEAIEPPVEAAQ